MYLLLIFCCALLPLKQHAVQIEHVKKIPESSAYKTEFIDLGETDISLEKLNKYALPVSYAPQINNHKQVTCNQSAYGELKGSSIDFMSPQISSIRSKCYGLNNLGDVVVGFLQFHSDVDWWIWSQENFTKTATKQIELNGIIGDSLYIRAINDSKMAVGVFKPSGMLRPIIWTPNDGLHHLGYYLGWDIAGVIWDVNDSGMVVGYIDENAVKTPFTWSKNTGLNRLANFKQHWKETTCRQIDNNPEFGDLAISDNNLLYGTFWENSQNLTSPTLAFWWDPQSDSFRKLDLDGMRINAINTSDTIVGSWNGQASLCDLGNKPVALSSLIKDLSPDWKLLDATDINCWGDIVGYATLKDKPHYFMLKRLNALVKDDDNAKVEESNTSKL